MKNRIITISVFFAMVAIFYKTPVLATSKEALENEFNSLSCTLNTDPAITIGNGFINLSTTLRAAGAIEYLQINGKEIVNINDHGRQIQYSTQLNGAGECLNPTEAGTLFDSMGPTSTSRYIAGCKVSNTKLYTKNQPAYWLEPNYPATYCGPGQTRAINTTVISPDYFHKVVEVGYRGLHNVVRFVGKLAINEPWTSSYLAGPNYYLKSRFNRFYTFNIDTGTLTEIYPDSVGTPLFSDFDMPVMSDGETYLVFFNPKQIATAHGQHYAIIKALGTGENATNIIEPLYWDANLGSNDLYSESYLVATDATNFKRDIYKLLSTVSWEDVKPTGYLDFANTDNSGRIAGWTFDPNNMNLSLDLHIFKKNTDGGETLVGVFKADQLRADVNSVFQITGNHGFDFNLNSLSGVSGTNQITIYAIDDQFQVPLLLTPIPITFTKIKPGDTNGDGLVNQVDVMTWLSHYRQLVAGVSNGDFTSDTKINILDFAVWLQNYEN